MNGRDPINTATDAMWWRICCAMTGSRAWPLVFRAGSARELTRVALNALLEADDTMLRAGLQVSRSPDYLAPDPIGGEIWRAMVRAALEELDATESAHGAER